LKLKKERNQWKFLLRYGSRAFLSAFQEEYNAGISYISYYCHTQIGYAIYEEKNLVKHMLDLMKESVKM
jgi:hypothetical protein